MLHLKASIEPTEIPERLAGYPLLKGYCFTLFSSLPYNETRWEPVNSKGPLLPSEIYREVLELAAMTRRRAVQRTRTGIIVFAIPFSMENSPLYCIAGVGFRDTVLDLAEIESLARSLNENPVDLLENIQAFPIGRKNDVEDAALKIGELLAAMGMESRGHFPSDEFRDKISSVSGICSVIDNLTTCESILSLYLDTLTIIFDVPSVALLLTPRAMQQLIPSGKWPPSVLGTIIPHLPNNLLPENATEKSFILRNEITLLLPETGATRAVCFRFWNDDCGCVALLDVEIEETDLSLMELINSRVATRLRQLMQEEKLIKANSRSQKLLSLMKSMLLEDGYFCDSLLMTAANLVGAAGGSIMTIDGTGSKLRVESALGRNAQVAKTFIIDVGKGIAGMVAATGQPLLVADVETDRRVARCNRPGFTTKSFISLPFRYDEKIIGVLNVSEKVDSRPFTITDLETLSFFVDNTAGLLDHLLVRNYDSSSAPFATDEMTGLCNRDFLLLKMREELPRSRRRNKPLTIMMVKFEMGNCEAQTNAGMVAGTLKAVGEQLVGTLRDADTIGRYGENVFCIILSETGKNETAPIIQRIKRITEDVSDEAGGLSPITAFMGVSSFPEDGGSTAELLTKAEDGMSCIFFPPPPEEMKEATPGTSDEIRLYRPRQFFHPARGKGTMDSPPGADKVLHLYGDLPVGQ